MVIATQGRELRNTDFWENVFIRFATKWRQIHSNAPETLEIRAQIYCAFVTAEIIGKTHTPEFTEGELFRIGEFFAVSITRDIQEAIIVDPERAALVIFFLPEEWITAANLDPEKFDSWYRSATGKELLYRE